jgi:hypothetical protein
MSADSVTATFNILKAGLQVQDASPVDVLVGGTDRNNVNQGPASVTEYYDQTSSIFGSTITEQAITASWMYDGASIAGFRVNSTGFVQIGSTVDIAVHAGPSYIDDAGVARLPYQIVVAFNNITGGTQQTTISAEAAGDGGGRSLAA